MAAGNFRDALLSLNTYIDLISKAKERIAKGGIEKDFDDDSTIILTMVEGIRALCKYMNNGKRAMEIAELLEDWLDGWEVTTNENIASSALVNSSEAGGEENIPRISVVRPEVLCAAWRGIGIGTSHWARQTVDASIRPEIQQSAEDAFKKGLEYDDEDVDCMFGLAMVLAETRHIEEAMEVIKRALVTLSYLKSEGEELALEPDEQEVVAREYRRLVVSFWHLLSLLLSASEEFDGALRVCDAVFEELGGEENLWCASNTQTDIRVYPGDSTGDVITSKMGPDEKENILEVKMTQMALVELMEGPDAALNLSDELLRLYSSLFYSKDVEEQITKVQQAKVQQFQEQFRGLEVDDKPHRLRPISRYSSRFGRSHKKQDSSTVSISTANTVRPVTSGSTVRPLSSHTTNPPKIEVTDANGGSSHKFSASNPTADGGKLHKKVGRANSVSGGTIRRRKSLGSVNSTASSQGQVSSPQVSSSQTDLRKVRRSPSLGSTAIPRSGSGNPPVPPLPSSTPQTPTRTHIFHMHKHVKVPSSNSEQPQKPPTPPKPQHIDTIGNRTEDPTATGQVFGSTIPSTPRTVIRRPTRLFPLATRIPEPSLPEQVEREKFLSCLRRIWLFIAALYRRGGYFDEALQAVDEAAKIRTLQETGEADLLVERGFLALTQGKKGEALGHFENALAYDWDHPYGTVGLCQIILELVGEPQDGKVSVIPTGQQIPSTVDRPGSVYATLVQSPLLLKQGAASNLTNSTTTIISPATTTQMETTEEEELAPLIARNRAYGLLSQLTRSGRGWDCSEAWFALARSYEATAQVEKAKGVYWWCVGLEDTRPVRGWGGVSGGGVGSGRGWGGRVV